MEERDGPPSIDGVAALRSLPDPAVVVDAQGVILEASESIESLLGWPAHRLVGRPLATIVPPQDRSAHQRGFAAFYASSPPDDRSTRTLERVQALRPDGSTGHVDVAVRRVAGTDHLVGLLPDARSQLVSEAAATIGGATGWSDALDRLASAAVPALADLCIVDVADSAGRIQRAAVRHDGAELPVAACPVGSDVPQAGSDHPIAEVIRSGSTRWGRTVPESFLPAAGDGSSRLDLEAYICVPLIATGRVLGALTLVSTDSERSFSETDVATAEHLAEQIAGALGAAWLHDVDRRVAVQLQHLLLPPHLPVIESLDLAARYRTGEAGTDVGGDFYDAAVLPSGRLGVVIGDVEGHGPEAAARMGQLRSALRTLAGQHREATAVIDALRWSWDLLGFDWMATLCVARIDPADGSGVLVSAGHPPPLLQIDGTSRWARVEPGPPLGIAGEPSRQTSLQLAPGERILFYTDGLVEHRGESLAVGLERLRLASETAGGDGGLAGWCERIFRDVQPSGEDDVALLAVQYTGPAPG